MKDNGISVTPGWAQQTYPGTSNHESLAATRSGTLSSNRFGPHRVYCLSFHHGHAAILAPSSKHFNAAARISIIPFPQTAYFALVPMHLTVGRQRGLKAVWPVYFSCWWSLFSLYFGNLFARSHSNCPWSLMSEDDGQRRRKHFFFSGILVEVGTLFSFYRFFCHWSRLPNFLLTFRGCLKLQRSATSLSRRSSNWAWERHCRRADHHRTETVQYYAQVKLGVLAQQYISEHSRMMTVNCRRKEVVLKAASCLHEP